MRAYMQPYHLALLLLSREFISIVFLAPAVHFQFLFRSFVCMRSFKSLFFHHRIRLFFENFGISPRNYYFCVSILFISKSKTSEWMEIFYYFPFAFLFKKFN